MKTSELIGATLDHWVAKCEGIKIYQDAMGNPTFEPSTEWKHGGPIIQRERIEIRPESNGQWSAWAWDGMQANGDAPLIAAMRAYVASKFGDEVPD